MYYQLRQLNVSLCITILLNLLPGGISFSRLMSLLHACLNCTKKYKKHTKNAALRRILKSPGCHQTYDSKEQMDTHWSLFAQCEV